MQMPTIEVSKEDLCRLIGKDFTMEGLGDAISFAKAEIDAADGDLLRIDIKDSNRPDLWSAEGIAREVGGRFGKAKPAKYSVRDSGVVVTVDKKNKAVRPYTVCAVVKNLDVTKDVLSQMIQLQEKICGTFGRNRKEVALGVYDFDRIKPPIRFTTVKPNGVRFSPLDFEGDMTPKEILERHPKGREYGHLLAGLREYPVFIDSRDEVLSIPPIINSNYSGKVTERTKNIFIECSGFNLKFLMPALNVLVAALADRGAEIGSVKVIYPDRVITTPDLALKKTFVEMDYAKRISGLDLSGDEMCKLLEQANCSARIVGKRIEVNYPAYRQDIMHQRDIVEDMIVSYGYGRIEPVIPELKTAGAADGLEVFSDKVAEIMAGLGFQEILSYSMTSKENLFKRMNRMNINKVNKDGVVEIENPVSLNWNVFRDCLLPSLMDFFSNNQHVSYAQSIFEIGDAVLVDKKEETGTRNARKLAAAIADSRVGYGDMLSVLDAVLRKLKVKYKLKKCRHPSFIEGRVADILVRNRKIGVIGEITPSVLGNWKLEMPVSALEINLEGIFNF